MSSIRQISPKATTGGGGSATLDVLLPGNSLPGNAVIIALTSWNGSGHYATGVAATHDTLTAVPPEILYQIISFCDYGSLFHLRNTCHTLRFYVPPDLVHRPSWRPQHLWAELYNKSIELPIPDTKSDLTVARKWTAELHLRQARVGFVRACGIFPQNVTLGRLFCSVCVRILPRPVRDRLYAFVARNRLRFFGRRATCYVQNAGDEDRFLG
jgi:hypothetical protein